jgi:CRP/FNR family transcriptional regulator
MDTASLLQQIPIFGELDDAIIARLAERCVQKTVAPGTVVFTAGEECRGLYIVASGRVRVYRLSAEGREQVLHIEGPGRPVAELPLFDGAPYPASAVTTEESRLVFLPRAELVAIYRENPDVADAIIRGLGRRLRHLVHVAETLAFRDVAARLALLLAGYADRAGERTDAGVELAMDRTREELGLEIGAARESVSRALRQLHRRGLVVPLARDRFLIPDLAKLRTLAAPGARARP